jgi:hypothetical protein
MKRDNFMRAAPAIVRSSCNSALVENLSRTMQDEVSPRLPNRESASSQSALKHREFDHAIFDLASRESRASNSLERVSMFAEIAEGLILCPKRRLETAQLPNRADRQNEIYGLSLAPLGLGHDSDILGHRGAFSVEKSI